MKKLWSASIVVVLLWVAVGTKPASALTSEHDVKGFSPSQLFTLNGQLYSIGNNNHHRKLFRRVSASVWEDVSNHAEHRKFLGSISQISQVINFNGSVFVSGLRKHKNGDAVSFETEVWHTCNNCDTTWSRTGADIFGGNGNVIPLFVVDDAMYAVVSGLSSEPDQFYRTTDGTTWDLVGTTDFDVTLTTNEYTVVDTDAGAVFMTDLPSSDGIDSVIYAANADNLNTWTTSSSALTLTDHPDDATYDGSITFGDAGYITVRLSHNGSNEGFQVFRTVDGTTFEAVGDQFAWGRFKSGDKVRVINDRVLLTLNAHRYVYEYTEANGWKKLTGVSKYLAPLQNVQLFSFRNKLFISYGITRNGLFGKIVRHSF